MQYLGVNYNLKHIPALDPEFIPFGVWTDAYLKGAKQPIAIAVERDKGHVSVRHTFIHGTAEMAEADYRMKFVITGFYFIGSGMPAARPASMQRSSHAMLRPSSRITCMPSSS